MNIAVRLDWNNTSLICVVEPWHDYLLHRVPGNTIRSVQNCILWHDAVQVGGQMKTFRKNHRTNFRWRQEIPPRKYSVPAYKTRRRHIADDINFHNRSHEKLQPVCCLQHEGLAMYRQTDGQINGHNNNHFASRWHNNGIVAVSPQTILTW
jgi:hypothetical protein